MSEEKLLKNQIIESIFKNPNEDPDRKIELR